MATLTTEGRIRAAALALTPHERASRFAHLRRTVLEGGGVVLDEGLTLELVTLGQLLGIEVQCERVALPSFGRSAERP